MKEKKKKKLAKLEKQEKQKLEDKPKKKKKEKEKEKEKKSKLTETLSQEAVVEALPEAEEETAAVPEKRSQTKRKKTAKHAQKAPAGDAEAALLFRAMGDDVRLQIVQLIRANGELCAADLLKSVSIVQSTLSHHMKILCESGVVACRRQGKWSYYSIDAQKLEEAAAYLETMAEAAKAVAAGTEA